jgi:hypothetical protein
MRLLSAFFPSSIVGVSLIGLAGCFGGDDESASAPATPPSATAGALQPVTDSQLTLMLKAALAVSEAPKVMADMAAGGLAAAEAGGGVSPVSATVVQEAGVDEADLVKTLGDEVFSVRPAPVPAVQRFRLQPDAADAALLPLETLPSPLRNGAMIQGLYAVPGADRLAVLGESGGYGDDYTRWFSPLSWAGGDTELAVLETGGGLAVKYTLGINAQLVGSRRVGNVLYLVLRGRMQPVGFDAVWAAGSTAANTAKLETLEAAKLLPTLSINGAAAQPLLPPDSCLAPVTLPEASADVITLVGIDLSAETPVWGGRCFAGQTEAFYLSPANLYLATTRWNYTAGPVADMAYPPAIQTDIHRFALTGLTPDYRGSGTVTGHLGFDQNRKSFRLGEHNGILRVATQTAERWGPVAAVPVAVTAAEPVVPESPVRLTLLKAAGDRAALEVLSTLPNDRRPAPLGKAGEQLYASRFLGDRGYLVTYRLTDPLYVLDLSDPADPKVAGELHVEGYSDYLLPLSGRYLLGVGKDAAVDGSAGDGRFAWYQGVKISLIDVGDPATSREVAREIIGKRGTDATVLRNHHGIALLASADGGSVRVALPVALHDTAPDGMSGSPADYYGFTRMQLSRFTVNLTAGTLTRQADLLADDAAAERGLGEDRALLAAGQAHHYRNGRWASWRWD